MADVGSFAWQTGVAAIAATSAGAACATAITAISGAGFALFSAAAHLAGAVVATGKMAVTGTTLAVSSLVADLGHDAAITAVQQPAPAKELMAWVLFPCIPNAPLISIIGEAASPSVPYVWVLAYSCAGRAADWDEHIEEDAVSAISNSNKQAETASFEVAEHGPGRDPDLTALASAWYTELFTDLRECITYL
eukprot:gnl/MRDRNA2_/MRDRNA2_21164_c0_seq1.p1 gnl/MRDRNA2_/MRDRNA2_21164_c0~~gnl/MRDRNA2_/MRDRNA2_21164_c0_seq1.p1  ORF type:complete len:193 (-),score=36.41 gnl/MRDRNA2_/MRDRNA2_21164_c0_seq1:32-610(-)